MEEIKIDFSRIQDSESNMAFLNSITEKARVNGVQIGIPWDKKVYSYLFDSAIPVDLNKLFSSVDYILTENIQED